MLTRAEASLAAVIFHRKVVPIGEVKKYLTGKVEIRRCKSGIEIVDS